MKIAIYTTRYPWLGWIEKHVEILVNSLRKEWHEVSIITANKIFKLFRKQFMAQILGSILFQIGSCFKHQKYDIINIQSGPWGLLFYPIKKRGARIFYTVHHTYYQQIKYLNEWFKYPLLIIEKIIYQFADKIISVSESTKMVLIDKYKIKKQIYLLWNPLMYDKNKISNKRIKKTILFIWRLDKRKNPIFMIFLLKELIKKDTKFRMFFIGNGILLGECRKLTEEYQLWKYIKFLWNLNENKKKYYMSICEYLVVPSIFEWQGIVYLEGRSMGMKVLCSDCDWLKDMCPLEKRFKGIEDATRIINANAPVEEMESLDRFTYKNYLLSLKNIF